MKKRNLINRLYAQATQVAHDYKENHHIMTDEPMKGLIEQFNTCPWMDEVEEEVVKAYGFKSVEEYNEQLFDGIDPQLYDEISEEINAYYDKVDYINDMVECLENIKNVMERLNYFE